MISLYFENYLAHYGVKGMKWGVRKSRRQRRQDARKARREEKAKKPTQKERREKKRAARREADEKYVNYLLEQANGPLETFIQVNGGIVMTGDEFTRGFLSGAPINLRNTRVWAQETSEGSGQLVRHR